MPGYQGAMVLMPDIAIYKPQVVSEFLWCHFFSWHYYLVNRLVNILLLLVVVLHLLYIQYVA